MVDSLSEGQEWQPIPDLEVDMPDALPPRTGLLKYTGTPEEQAQATEMYLQGLQGLPIGVASQVTTPNFTTPEGRTDWAQLA